MSYRRLFLLFAFLSFALVGSTRAQDESENNSGERLRRPPKQAEPTVEPVKTAPKANVPNTSGSLFSDTAPGGNLLGDFKPRNVGDLVFIDVIETSNASVSSNAKRSRDSGNVGGATPLIRVLPLNGAATAADVITAMGTRSYEGTGETGRKSTLSARVTGRVVEVLPNGDFRVVAQKNVKINKENELLTLSGLVRRRDVGADNAIPTTMVGELQVMLNGKGVASADNAPGWLYRLFDKLSPF